MAATATRTLKNFVNGEYVEPESGRYSDVINPATGETYARRPSRVGETSTPRSRPHRGVRGLARSTPAERQLALLRFADAIESRADEFVAAEVENTGKPTRAHGLGGDPADGRPDPLLRGCRAHPRGRLGGRVHARHDLVHPPRADRRRRPGHALELPAADGDLEDRAGDRRRQHGRAQAERHHARLDAADGRDRRRVPPAGRASTSSAATATPARALVVASDPALVVDHRFGARGHGGRERGGRRPQAGPPRARRQGAGDRLRRRRHRRRGRGDRRRRLLQRRPGLHGRDPRDRRARGLRRLRRRARRAGQGAPGPACPTTRTSSSGRSTTTNQFDARRGMVDRRPATPTSSRAGSAPGDRASSTSRRSSPTCARTTR